MYINKIQEIIVKMPIYIELLKFFFFLGYKYIPIFMYDNYL